MSVKLSYRKKVSPKNRKCKYYKKQLFSVYTYRDENGVEQTRIIKKIQWGKYEDVNASEENQPMVQDSIKE